MKKLDVEVHESQPSNFLAKMEAAACFIEIDGSILLLQNGERKQEAGMWGVPGGKLETKETPEAAARRELFEETGILIEHAEQIQPVGVLYMRKFDIDFIFHLFGIHLNELPQVRLSDEHLNYKWANSEEVKQMPLMRGAKEVLLKYRRFQANIQ